MKRHIMKSGVYSPVSQIGHAIRSLRKGGAFDIKHMSIVNAAFGDEGQFNETLLG